MSAPNRGKTFTLLPAVRPAIPQKLIPEVPTATFVAWTFGRGSVIWKIWPAVIFHTLFAAAVVSYYEFYNRTLVIPNVLLTVLGVVIGFVISYRAMSGYDRYWAGRAAWSDVIRNSRAMGRVIWYHIPPRLTPKTPEEIASGKVIRSAQELNKCMAEKRMALDLVLGFAVALKHHIRGELGPYYDDLYHLVRPLHEHSHSSKQQQRYAAADAAAAALPRRNAAGVTSSSHLPMARTPPPPATSSGSPTGGALHPVYGTFESASRNGSRTSLKAAHRAPSPSHVSSSSAGSHHEALLPGNNPRAQESEVAESLIPFAGTFYAVRRWFTKDTEPIIPQYHGGPPPRKWGGPIHPGVKLMKRKPDTGENLPEEVLRCLSEWASVLEDRGTVGSGLGGLLGGIATFEASLATLEHILTTPLPFVFATHIRHTVWLYLFLLPFQLMNDFSWHTVPAVAIGAFIYLGFVAAGEEIEQPFGYDENDLDLDLFCEDIIKVDIESLKAAPCLNAWLAPHERDVVNGRESGLVRHRSMTLTEATALDEFEDVSDEEVEPGMMR
ncbi:hypothetical protein MKEN_00314500 [Mycena kentingensis (nom. inval.)]|nr:hypothetical protein MKEN_00314500 [Mycena kentingensis (nom. inval.)]